MGKGRVGGACEEGGFIEYGRNIYQTTVHQTIAVAALHVIVRSYALLGLGVVRDRDVADRTAD